MAIHIVVRELDHLEEPLDAVLALDQDDLLRGLGLQVAQLHEDRPDPSVLAETRLRIV